MALAQIFLRFIAIVGLFAGVMLNVSADEGYVEGWSLPIGSKAPKISALDSNGVVREFADLSAEQGLLIFFNRSANW